MLESNFNSRTRSQNSIVIKFEIFHPISNVKFQFKFPTFSDINAFMYMGSRKSQKKRFRFSGRKSSRWFTRRVVRIGGGSAAGGGVHAGDLTHEDNVHDAHQINEDEIQVLILIGFS